MPLGIVSGNLGRPKNIPINLLPKISSRHLKIDYLKINKYQYIINLSILLWITLWLYQKESFSSAIEGKIGFEVDK